jgi:hypothetical protein
MCAIFGPTKNFGKLNFKKLTKSIISKCSKQNKNNNNDKNSNKTNSKKKIKIPFKAEENLLTPNATTITTTVTTPVEASTNTTPVV